jgi:DnaK suppressor protein
VQPVEFARRELEYKRKELIDRLDRIRRDRLHPHRSPLSGFVRQAARRENAEKLEALECSTQAELGEITRALDRVVMGDYGQCARCGGPIEAQRLRALLYATWCAACAASY